MDSIVHGVTKSRTQLSLFTFTAFHPLSPFPFKALLESASFFCYSQAAAKIAIKFSITHTLQNSHTINNVPSD